MKENRDSCVYIMKGGGLKRLILEIQWEYNTQEDGYEKRYQEKYNAKGNKRVY